MMKFRSKYCALLCGVVLMYLSAACRQESEAARLIASIKSESPSELMAECLRSARLRAAYLDAKGEPRSRSTKNEEDAFRRVIRTVSARNTPKLVCKKNVAGGVYCARSIDVLTMYRSEAVDQIGAEFDAIARELGEILSESALLYCGDGSTEIVEIGELNDLAFATSTHEASGWSRNTSGRGQTRGSCATGSGPSPKDVAKRVQG